MRREWILLGCILLTLPVYAQKGPFPKKKCTVPYNETAATNLYVDNHCGLKGAVSAKSTAQRKAADRGQNAVKNNLCATGSPTVLTFADFATLQQQVDASHITYGTRHSGPPPDRSTLQADHLLNNGSSVHEGSIVTLVAFILDSKYSPQPNADSGETANCNAIYPTRVDIHVTLGEDSVLVPKKGDERDKILCSSITAEVIPHMRPANWSNEWLTNVAKLKRPVRVTGQLMFDGSHLPCANGKPQGTGNPLRVASWEIHPIYQLAVCKHEAFSACAATDETAWDKISQVPDLPDAETEFPD